MALEGSIRPIGDRSLKNPCHRLPQRRRHPLWTMVPLFKLVPHGVSFISQPDVRGRLKVSLLLLLLQSHKSKRLSLSRTRMCPLGRSGGQILPLCLLWCRVVQYRPGLPRLLHVPVCLAPPLHPPSRWQFKSSPNPHIHTFMGAVVSCTFPTRTSLSVVCISCFILLLFVFILHPLTAVSRGLAVLVASRIHSAFA